MANTIGFGQAAVNNTNGFGQAPTNNTIDFGEICADSWSPETNLTGAGATPPFSNTKSIELDGIDDYVDCGNNINFAVTNISISAWIKTTADGIFMGADDSNGARRRWVFRVTASGTLNFLFWNASVALKSITGTTVVDDGVWHHVMAVNNGTDLKLYVDGVLDNSSSDGDTMNTNLFTYIHIGNSNYNGGNAYFDGLIDEVAIWSTDQSSNVATIYNSGVPNDISSLSPLGYWRMGDGSTYPTINDLGSGGNNGTMTNFSTFSTDVPT